MDTPTHYCEYLIGNLSQPLNALSSVLFILLGTIVFYQLRKSGNKSILVSSLPFLFGLVGVGSILWHTTSQVWADYTDTISIVLFITVLSYTIFRELYMKKVLVWGSIVSLLIASLVLEQIQILNGSLPYIFLFLVFSVVFYYLLKKHQEAKKPIITGLTLFAIAIIIRTLDNELCNTILIGTHFIWHILVAIAGYYFIRVVGSLRP